MKKILLPTDFSENALNAIDYAVQLFHKEECTFHILHAYTMGIYNYEYLLETGGYARDYYTEIEKVSMSRLEVIRNDIKKKYSNSKHKFTLISAHNTFIGETKILMKENTFDLIVMGTKGTSGAKEVLFGSNTVQMIKKATCPVMAIPQNYSFEKPTEILFPTDYQVDYSKKHLNLLLTIATNYKSIVHILKVSTGRDPNIVEQKNTIKLNNLLSDINDAYYTVENQEIPSAISEFQESNEVHLLVMINNRHSFLENLFIKPVIHQIGFQLTVPFLVIPSDF